MVAIALCSTKGGTGKTTISFNLAERACADGLAVAVVDFDPQEGFAGLVGLRPESLDRWAVFRCRVDVKGAEDLERLKREGRYDLVICDLPGSDSMSLVRLLQQMDLVLSPVGPSASELMVAANFAWMVQPFDLPVVFVPNNLPVSPQRRQILLNELDRFAESVCPVTVYRRMAQVDALRSGRGVCEAAPRSPAASEIDSLWRWVAGHLEIGVGGGNDAEIPVEGIAISG